MILPVILSGGTGSRLWPVSRESYPKQFLVLNSGSLTLLQETLRRVEGLPGCLAPLLVCHEQHRFLVAEQLRGMSMSASRILLEPAGRNTAPALALAALASLELDEDPCLLVMPADHAIRHTDLFVAAVEQGLALVEAGRLVTFGIVPHSPHTGYGYIRVGPAEGAGHRVDDFVEKPDPERARQYLASGDHLWNSGIFLFRARQYLDELRQQAGDILDCCEAAYRERQEDLDFLRVGRDAFLGCRSDSIDYAILENTRDAAVIPMDPGWSDIGSWDALFDLKAGESDERGNVVQGDVLLEGTRGSLVRSESRLVATVGVDNLIVVETEDAVLVADRGHAQAIRNIVARLQDEARSEYLSHRSVYRPWGHYRTLVESAGFQVKEIVVKSGHALSLQMHHHRAEHWVVVQGTARVTRGERRGEAQALDSFLLSEEESTYISRGTVHRLENPGLIPLRLIEVQTGSYLSEDDILRFEDAYGR
ncbi:mannose-1-phosphate guanylyltransferase [Modicisalibacter ilicicola DSM 19980]|uniref:mannose-1-phosphate guanylyltransferase n=1 Tax=Modicisalibacter ilicicola DSM 19980 TaxID=1121942 RepID=A0A1M4SX98_9GAMM|nr:mannose-1-phosphate guanylyltransferase/mannose-6-phosphate isomerase [Halomonas ilicicola]SHE36856.1 mannose-1-phosphate guanylyltransferase [Halomonas ilicicola DSM 19980]